MRVLAALLTVLVLTLPIYLSAFFSFPSFDRFLLLFFFQDFWGGKFLDSKPSLIYPLKPFEILGMFIDLYILPNWSLISPSLSNQCKSNIFENINDMNIFKGNSKTYSFFIVLFELYRSLRTNTFATICLRNRLFSCSCCWFCWFLLKF